MARAEARVQEEGGLARSFLREFRVLVGTLRFLEREVDVAARDWFASEDLEVRFEILPERVVLVASAVGSQHRAQKRRIRSCRDKNSEEQEWVVNPTNMTAAPLYSPVWRRRLMSAGGSTIRH